MMKASSFLKSVRASFATLKAELRQARLDEAKALLEETELDG